VISHSRTHNSHIPEVREQAEIHIEDFPPNASAWAKCIRFFETPVNLNLTLISPSFVYAF
jgi:hypothetical protein